jgi:hypothetical protein
MKVAVSILFAVLALVALRSFLNGRFRETVTAATTNQAGACLEMLGNTTREIDRYTYLVGSIRNNCDRKFSHVTIAFKHERLIDAKNTRPNSPILAYSSDMQPFETREFKTMFRVDKTLTYRFDGITAY